LGFFLVYDGGGGAMYQMGGLDEGMYFLGACPFLSAKVLHKGLIFKGG